MNFILSLVLLLSALFEHFKIIRSEGKFMYFSILLKTIYFYDKYKKNAKTLLS